MDDGEGGGVFFVYKNIAYFVIIRKKTVSFCTYGICMKDK